MITLSLGEAAVAGGTIAAVAALVGVGAHRFGEVAAEGIAAVGRRLRGTGELPAVVVAGPAPRRPAPAAIEPPPAPRPEPAAAPAPQEMPASVWHGPLLADELLEPALPALPDHPWLRNPTGTFPKLPLAAVWPAAPREAALTAVAGHRALTDRVEVRS